MRLAAPVYADGIQQKSQTKFNGLNHNIGAEDGELWDMSNLTSLYYPLLASRPKRKKYGTVTTPNGMFDWDGLATVDGTSFKWNGTSKGVVTNGEKTMCAIGDLIIIMPDKKYFDVVSGTFGNLESSWTGSTIWFSDGTYMGELADANAIYVPDVVWSDYFKPGDAVTVSGCTTNPSNNKTAIIREISGDWLYFYENCWELDPIGQPYSETGSLKIERTVPTLDYMCENENRLWGCSGNVIYASKLGDPFNFNVYDGVNTDSYAVDTGSAGNFTGCISYLGYPVFFKEDHIYKVYGSMPSNYEVMGSATLGVAPGSGRSLAIAGEILFYLSSSGFVAYSGGIPQLIHGAFGTSSLKNAKAGSDGVRYYVSYTEGNTKHLAVYDTQHRTWHLEDNLDAVCFVRHNTDVLAMATDGNIWMLGIPKNPPVGATDEATVAWSAEFVPFEDKDPNKKTISKLLIRVELETGATATAWMRYDSTGSWGQVGETITADTERSYYLPIIPRRVDNYQLKITGTGDVKIHSITREVASGSPFKSRAGRA